DTQDHAAGLGEFLDGLHHRRKSRDGASPQIVAVGESAGQDDGVAIREILGLVPYEFDGLLQDVADGVKSVVVAIGPGENDDSKFHAVVAPCCIAGTPILAHTSLIQIERPAGLEGGGADASGAGLGKACTALSRPSTFTRLE